MRSNGKNSLHSQRKGRNGLIKDIGRIMRDGKSIDRAGKQAVREALREHQRLGHRVVIWRDGKIVTLKPEEI